MESCWNPNSNTLETDRPQQERPAACVIAQQYSSPTFVSFPQEKKNRRCKFFNVLKLR
jgi:hypothetical protein